MENKAACYKVDYDQDLASAEQGQAIDTDGSHLRLASVEEGMQNKAEHYRALLEEVFVLDEQGLSDEAAAKSKQVSEAALAAGDAAYAKFFLGESLCLRGDLQKGLKLESEAVENLQDVPFILTNYGVLLSITGSVKKALVYLDMALELDGYDLQALAQKGVCLAKLNRYAEALPCFDRILERDPGNMHALRNKGVCLSNLDQEDEAMQLFDHVLERNPEDKHARSEKNILKSELELRRTPFGWVAYKIHKSLIPYLKAKFFSS